MGVKMGSYFKNSRKMLAILLILMLIVTTCPVPVSAVAINDGVQSEAVKSVGEEKPLFLGKDKSGDGEDTLAPKIKSKLDTKLLKLTNKQAMSSGETKEKLKLQMKSSDQFISKGTSLKIDESTASEDLVFVYIRTKTSEGVKAIEPYVYKVVDEDGKNKLMAAMVEVDKLEKLENLEEVLNVTTVIKPVANSITSQGDKLHKADVVRSLNNGVIGTGVKVGVISNGVDHIADAINMGELPATVRVLSNTYGGEEGIAMMEIIHDLAPGAELYFHDCTPTTIGFNGAVDELIQAGCKVIVDDIGWFGQPYFEDGIIASHIRELVKNCEINYISSAGNSASKHYQGRYYNDGGNWHDFSSGTSPNKNIYVNVSPGQTIKAVLQWDDPFENAVNDYDLYAYNSDTGERLEYSNDTQAGGAYAIEFIEYTNYTGSSKKVALRANNRNGYAQAKTLELYVLGGSCYQYNIVPGDSIFGQAAVPEVIAAGAIDVDSPNQIAYYSSQGPVTTRSGEVRRKPDVCGAAGVRVTGAGGFSSTFHGTSAAAPHIAGIAALMRSKYPTKNGVQIRDLIQNNAVDLGSTGFDYVFGCGRADANNAFMAGNPSQGIPVTAVNLSNTQLNVKVGKKGKLGATVSPTNATNNYLTFSSSNEYVAKVDEYGYITGLTKGTARITVTGAGGITAYCDVTVDIPVSSVVLDPQYRVAKGAIMQLRAAVWPADAGDKRLMWSSSDTRVATIDSNGNVVGVGCGTTYITATSYDGPSTRCEVRVYEDLKIVPIRYAGANRYDTAEKVSQAGWQASENVVLVNAYGFADALTGVPFAYQKDAPILLTDPNFVTLPTSEEIRRLGAKNVYLLGGTGVISYEVENHLRALGYNVFRISGVDRFETAIKIGNEVMKNNTSKTAVLTTAYNYPDALAMSSYAAMNQYPILYTSTNSLNERTRAFIQQNGINKIIIPGGAGAVSDAVANELMSKGIAIERTAGPDRYTTALNIVKKYEGSFKKDRIIATGSNFPDALAGGVLAAKKQIPILLVDNTSTNDAVRAYIRANTDSNLYILGGTGVISENVLNKLIY